MHGLTHNCEQGNRVAAITDGGGADCIKPVPDPRATAERISVLLVEDHALVRRGLRLLLEDSSEITVVGEASDGVRAINMARELAPRVVVMDCALPAMSGLLATKYIAETLPDTFVLMLSMYAENTWVRKALNFGARGFIVKNARELDLIAAVKRVANGELVIDPQVCRPAALKGERADGLTMRELQVLKDIVAGKSNKEIAKHLEISVNTVGVHRANMMEALNVHNAAALVVYALQHGLTNIV